jgi:hypothetical protein
MGDVDGARKNIDQARSDWKYYMHTQLCDNGPFKPLFLL